MFRKKKNEREEEAAAGGGMDSFDEMEMEPVKTKIPSVQANLRGTKKEEEEEEKKKKRFEFFMVRSPSGGADVPAAAEAGARGSKTL
jgi:hypothetical protein